MTRKALFVTALWAVGLGTALAFATGEQRAISIEIWLVGFSLWFAGATLGHLLRDVPSFPPRLIALIRRPRREAAVADHRPFGLRGLEGLLIRARDHERAHVMQLRPHFTAIADHYLPRHHGFDPASEPDRVQDVLGDVAWLIDPAVTTRAPTLDEMESFLDRLIPEQQSDQKTFV